METYDVASSAIGYMESLSIPCNVNNLDYLAFCIFPFPCNPAL